MKQELLKWIYENKIGRPSVFGLGAVETVYMDDLIEKINELEEPQVTNEQAWNKIAEAYPETAQNLRITLDHAVYGHEAEPHKAKVPAFVAEWFEEHKDDLEQALYETTIEIPDKGATNEFECWFIDGLTNSYEILTRMKYGYEVEEEPKYRVVLPSICSNSKRIIVLRKNQKDCISLSKVLPNTESDAEYLTEKEIKSVDKRYWQFAVPVEKV